MKNKEEPSVGSTLRNPSTPADRHIPGPRKCGDHRFNSPTGRCGVDRETNLAQVVRLTTAVTGGATNTDATDLPLIDRLVSSFCRTAGCGPACPVVWGGRPARAVLTRFILRFPYRWLLCWMICKWFCVPVFVHRSSACVRAYQVPHLVQSQVLEAILDRIVRNGIQAKSGNIH